MSEQSESIFTQVNTARRTECDGVPRIYGPFAALVRGADASGEQFVIKAELDDLSGQDFNLRLRQPIKEGAKLYVVAHVHRALVAIHGIVLKAESQEDELWCLRVSIF